MKNYIPTKDKKIGLETNDQIITEEEKGTYGYEFQLYTIDPIAVSDMKIVQGNCNIINWRGYYMIVKIKNIDYNFTFGFKAMYYFEKESGTNISKIGSDFSLEQLVLLIHSGLKAGGNELSEDDIIDAIDSDSTLIGTFTKLIGEGVASFNQLDAKAKKPKATR